MSKSEIHISTRFLTVSMIGLLAVGSAFGADKHASAPAPKASAPASHAASGGGSHGPSTASHGPSTASHGPTTASHGPTTSSAGHTTTTAGHTTTTSTAGHSTTTAGHTTTTSTAGHSTTAGTASHGTTAGGAHAATTGGTHATGAAAGTHTATAGGTHSTTGGSRGPVAKGHTTVATKSGGSVTKRADGKVASVHDAKRNMDVHRGLNGNRTVVHERADHTRVVVVRGGHGYVQRPYSYHGHEYGRRSYYYGGHYYHGYYGRYYYRGVYVNPYYPAYYYGPAYYGWAYNPWVTPVPYAWGWAGNPWYGYYGAWYTPFPVYASASLWLTDYLISQQLQAAYAAQAAANAAAISNAAALTPDVKQLIADEVKRQIALENAEAKAGQAAEPDAASSSIQRALTDGTAHVFVAGADLDVVDSGGNECALSQGDAIQLTGQNPADANTINLAVLASKGGKECPKGDVVAVKLEDLQEMQNSMRQTIDQGMQDLQKKQGTGGLPAAPASAQAPPQQSPVAAAAPPPPPESEVVATLNQEAKEADALEKEASADTGAPVGEPPTVALGQSPDQVIAALGQPKSIMDLGPKKIYVYKDAKVTFRDGKVSDIQ